MNRREPIFEGVARQHFDFLVRENGFQCTAGSESKIRFESRLVFIEIYHGQNDYEVGINFGRIGRDESFSFTLFLRRFFPVVDQTLGERLAETPKGISDLTQAMGEALRTYGQRITSSGLSFYLHPDWLGSGRLETTPSRTPYQDVAYAPYGEN
jgi:hypothetical protein